jgi:hypothetical protein
MINQPASELASERKKNIGVKASKRERNKNEFFKTKNNNAARNVSMLHDSTLLAHCRCPSDQVQRPKILTRW